MSTPRSSSISPAKLALPIITLVLALVAVVVGYVQTTTGLADLSKALESQTATATDVYGGQSAIGVASAILSAGIIGVVISLAAIGILIGLNGFRRDVVVEDVILDDEFLDDDVDGIDELELNRAAAPAAPCCCGRRCRSRSRRARHRDRARRPPAEPVVAGRARCPRGADRSLVGTTLSTAADCGASSVGDRVRFHDGCSAPDRGRRRRSARRARRSRSAPPSSQGFFKTAPGQYGAGDVFIGITVPAQRRVARRFPSLPLAELDLLLDSEVHEHRLTGLIIAGNRFERGVETGSATKRRRAPTSPTGTSPPCVGAA